MEKLSDLGEFNLIKKISEKFDSDNEIHKGIGDDCAVLAEDDSFNLLTTDMLVEGDHFNREWQSPWQIGWKSIIVNVSDVAAMGGYPKWGLVSIAFPSDTEVNFADDLFEGMGKASEQNRMKIIGGDTTHGDILVINVALIGEVEKDNLCLRSEAKVGDLICVTGDLGKSWAGLELLRAGKQGYTDFYLQPRCQLEIARKIAPYVNAMIDVSDGLSSEVNHICDESGVGARIDKNKIPISKKTMSTGKKLGIDPMKWALGGGEDFEIVFTVSPENFDEVESIDPIIVGKIIEEGRYLIDDGKKELSGGYDHFDE